MTLSRAELTIIQEKMPLISSSFEQREIKPATSFNGEKAGLKIGSCSKQIYVSYCASLLYNWALLL